MKLELVSIELSRPEDEATALSFKVLMEAFDAAKAHKVFVTQDESNHRCFVVERSRFVRILANCRELTPNIRMRVFSLASLDDQLIAPPETAMPLSDLAHYDMSRQA